MKRWICAVTAAMLLLLCSANALAAEGNVTYGENAGEFIFAPGSDYSPTDLFPDLKDVMPGDTLTQAITFENKASEEVRVDVYIRALGAHPGSEEFLSQLRLRVVRRDGGEAALFDAPAHETAQLTDWVHLGTLYSGGQVDLDVILEVPAELDNAFQELVGYLDWEFAVTESLVLPIVPDPPIPPEPSDPPGPPDSPETGDPFPLWGYVSAMAVSLLALVALILLRKKKK